MKQAKGASRSSKDKEMASRLKKDAAQCERFTGRCAICGKLIRNGVSTLNHYRQHSFGGGE